jgi:hypothetical protein
MTTVREKVQLLEEKKYRQAMIQRDKGYVKVSKLFFDQQQQADYPLANQISAPTTYESLQIPDIESQSEETIQGVFLQNMKNLSGGDKKFAEDIMSDLQDAGFDSISLSFLNASFQDIKKKIVVQFKNGRITRPAVFLFLKKYVSTFDSNHDEVRDANVSTIDEEDVEVVIATPVQGESVFNLTPAKSKSRHNMYANIERAASRDKNIETEVLRFARDRDILTAKQKLASLRKASHNDLDKVEKFLYNYIVSGDYGSVKSVDKQQRSMKDFATPVKGKGVRKRVSFAGRGIQTNNISDKMYVDITHLNRNSLCLKYKSTKKIIGRPHADITDDQKDSVMSILKGDYIKNKYDKLRSEEKELIHDFAVTSQAKGVDFIMQTEALLNKFYVIIGEIDAGNDSPELARILKQTTEQLMKTKGLSRLEGLSVLEQIK